MVKCKSCTQVAQCIMCHFQDVVDAHDRVGQTVLEVVHTVSEGGKVATQLADLTEIGVEYYLRPNGDIIKFIDGHFANAALPAKEVVIQGNSDVTQIVSDTQAA